MSLKPSQSQVTKLELSGMIKVDKAFLNYRIKFPLLKILFLIGVYLGHEQVFYDLISSCPLIEDLTLEYWAGLEVVSVHGQPKLKVAKVFGVLEVDVDAPILEYLYVSNEELEFPCKININKCSNLRELFFRFCEYCFCH